jgi:hypothetical protein
MVPASWACYKMISIRLFIILQTSAGLPIMHFVQPRGALYTPQPQHFRAVLLAVFVSISLQTGTFLMLASDSSKGSYASPGHSLHG